MITFLLVYIAVVLTAILVVMFSACEDIVRKSSEFNGLIKELRDEIAWRRMKQ